MKLQTHFIPLIILIDLCRHLQAVPVQDKSNFIFELRNNTINENQQSNFSICTFDSDCPQNSWCNQEKCQCLKGWLTWNMNRKCSYKQISRFSSFVTSLFLGSTGIDWFYLSQKNTLYILTGLVKLLVSIASCMWIGVILFNKTASSLMVASCFSINLSLIGIIWWFTDWIRILLNKFPDGNGAPLI